MICWYSIYDRTFWLAFWLGAGAATAVLWFLCRALNWLGKWEPVKVFPYNDVSYERGGCPSVIVTYRHTRTGLTMTRHIYGSQVTLEELKGG